jgi:hypothetical protein
MRRRVGSALLSAAESSKIEARHQYFTIETMLRTPAILYAWRHMPVARLYSPAAAGHDGAHEPKGSREVACRPQTKRIVGP